MTRYSIIVFCFIGFLCGGCVNLKPIEAVHVSRIDGETFYQQRFQKYLEIRKSGKLIELYDTLANIPNADKIIPIPRKKNDTFSEDVINQAIQYASAANTSAFWIIKDGNVIVEEYFGEAEAGTFQISRSLSKPLGVIAIGRAIAEGYIQSLDQPASDFLVEWQGTPKEAILIRHLLDMRSGLARQERVDDSEHFILRAYLHPYHDEMIIEDYPLTNAPGEVYAYANANAELVAPIIERATGLKFERWIAEEILTPLNAAGGKIWLNRIGGTAHSGCCKILPIESWAKVALLVMQDGKWGDLQLLPVGFVKEMKTATPQNPYAGMGVYLGDKYIENRGAGNPNGSNMPTTYHSAPYLRPDLFLFDGNANQVVYFIPSEGLIIIRLGEAPPSDIQWDNAFLPNLFISDLDKE